MKRNSYIQVTVIKQGNVESTQQLPLTELNRLIYAVNEVLHHNNIFKLTLERLKKLKF